MEKTVRHGLLLDFYGGLLTEKQREVLTAYFEDDLSLGEIAEELGVSRAAVHDTVRRSLASLEEFEDRLGLLAREETLQKRLRRVAVEVERLSAVARDHGLSQLAGEIEGLGRQFLSLLEED